MYDWDKILGDNAVTIFNREIVTFFFLYNKNKNVKLFCFGSFLILTFSLLPHL